MTTTAARGEVLGFGDPNGVLSEEEIFAIVAEHADALALDGQRLLVLIPDSTRSAPLPLMFKALRAAFGERVAALDLLIALGTHPPMSDSAIDAMLGHTAAERGGSQVFNHEWERPETFVSLGLIEEEEIERISGGLLRQEVPVRLNRLVLEYDHLLVCGPVFPHEVVGFSGGNKYFFPGIAGQRHHQLHPLAGRAHHLVPDHRHQGHARAAGDRPRRGLHPPRRATRSARWSPTKGLAGLYVGTPEAAWSAAADLSAQRHVDLERPALPAGAVGAARRCTTRSGWAPRACTRPSPPIADGGEVIIYAPHLRTRSRVVHGKVITQIGYHVRDYFTRPVGPVQAHPLGRAGPLHPPQGQRHLHGRRRERPRIQVTLATGIPEDECRAINLGYRDPRDHRVRGLRRPRGRGRAAGAQGRASTLPAPRVDMTDPTDATRIGALLGDLTERLRRERRLVVAFSGGADSALLAAAAADCLGREALAVTAVSPSLPHSERLAAREFARAHRIRHLEVCTDEGDRPDYVRNDGDRCYHCKSSLVDALAPLAELLDATVALATNTDDLGDHRPGQRAAAERGLVFPSAGRGVFQIGRTRRQPPARPGDRGQARGRVPGLACRVRGFGDPGAARPDRGGRGGRYGP